MENITMDEFEELLQSKRKYDRLKDHFTPEIVDDVINLLNTRAAKIGITREQTDLINSIVDELQEHVLTVKSKHRKHITKRGKYIPVW
jgi:hypothetical protein